MRAARHSGLPVARIGLGAILPLPAGPLVSFGLAGTLTPDLAVGEVVTASRLVDRGGETLWAGSPLDLSGARVVVACSAGRVIDDPAGRAALGEQSGAEIVDMESSALAASGRLVGVLRVVSDAPGERLGRLAQAANATGDVDWIALAGAFLREPVLSARAAVRATRALRVLQAAAFSLGQRPGQTSIR